VGSVAHFPTNHETCRTNSRVVCKIYFISGFICSLTNKFISVKGKGKEVVPVLFLIEHRAMKAYWGLKIYIHSLFDLGTRWR